MLAVLLVGTCCLRVSSSSTMSTADAAWVAVTTLTGAGFGDVALSTPIERVVGCVLACTGLAMLGALASVVVALWPMRLSSSALSSRPGGWRRRAWPSLVAAHLATGTVAIAVADGMRVDRALYLATMTATGVGPGDIVPHTTLGRAATAAFSLASSVFFAALVGSLATAPLDRWRRRILETYGSVLTPRTLAELARGRTATLGLSDDDRWITRDQFTLLALLDQRLVSLDDLRLARDKFDQLDRDGSGRLSQNDLDLLDLDLDTALDFFEVKLRRRRQAAV